MKHIGIFAGSFDPIHQGHLAFALSAATVCGLDKVYFLPEAEPRHKPLPTPIKDRLALLKLALKPHKTLVALDLGDMQFNVKQSLPKLQKRFAGTKLYLLIGSDVEPTIKKWLGAVKLLKSMELICGHRQVAAKAPSKNKPKTIYTNFADINSSVIRRELTRGNLPHGLPPELHGYIQKHSLYGFAGGIASAK